MMPGLALVGLNARRWTVPVPLPLFLLWPLVPVGYAVAGLMWFARPLAAARVCTALRAFRDLRGLTIDIDTADDDHVSVRII